MHDNQKTTVLYQSDLLFHNMPTYFVIKQFNIKLAHFNNIIGNIQRDVLYKMQNKEQRIIRNILIEFRIVCLTLVKMLDNSNAQSCV